MMRDEIRMQVSASHLRPHTWPNLTLAGRADVSCSLGKGDRTSGRGQDPQEDLSGLVPAKESQV